MRECNGAIKKLTKEQVTDGKADKLRHKLLRIVTSFSAFLSDSSTFYQDLMLNLEGNMNKKGVDSHSHEMLRHHVYKCLLFLGDIARYTEQNSDSKEKNFSVALRYYERAAFMEPESGNPHNQMAVLAGYGSAECVAVFHYCRSILAKKPFAAGLENLLIFYNKVRKQHEAWLDGEGATDTVNSAAGFGKRKSREASKANKVKVFLMRFTHLHGTLFEVANHALQRKEGGGGGENSSASEDLIEVESSDLGWDVNAVLDSAHEVLLELEDLLTAAVFSDSLLLKMLVMCIFSVHINVPPSPEEGQGQGGQKKTGRADKAGGGGKAAAKRAAAQSGRGPRFTGESVALIVIYEYVKRIAGRVRALALPQAPSNSKKGGNNNNTSGSGSGSGGGSSGGGGGAKNSSYLNRLVPVLNVFCDWLECNSHYLLSSHASLALTGRGRSTEALYSNQGLIDTEGKSRASMRSSLCQLAELMGQQGVAGDAGGTSGGSSNAAGNKLWRPPAASSAAGGASTPMDMGKPLKEHIELHGFLPLASLYEGYFAKQGSASDNGRSHTHTSSAMPVPVPEESARERRARSFRGFVKSWVIPCAQREAVEAKGRRLAQNQQEEEASERKERATSEQTQAKRRQRGPESPRPSGTVPMLPASQDSQEKIRQQQEEVVAMAISTAAEEVSTAKSETETAASFTYFSPASDQLLQAPPAGQQDTGDMETEEMKNDGSGGGVDDTESVLGEEVVFKPAFAGLGLPGLGLDGQGQRGAMVMAESTQQPPLAPPPGLGGGAGYPQQGLDFLASLADPRLAAAMTAGGGTAALYEEDDLNKGPSPTDFLGEAPWWNADPRRPEEPVDGHQLFGGVNQSAAGLSLLQRISDASSAWMPEIAGGGGANGGVEDMGDLVLPPPVPLEHMNSFGAGPPATVNPDNLQTANPFFRS
jgi:hypothetical protein